MWSLVMLYFSWVLAGISAFFVLFALTNALWLFFYTKKAKICGGFTVSVCIPARNEENNIEKCVRSLLNQTYVDYDVYVLDDNSTDGTYEILQNLQKEYPEKLKLLKGKPLEKGWTGKIFAMHQLVSAAKGEYLLFTDADTVHNPDSISFVMTNLISHNADMASGFIKQKLATFGEKITIPLMFMLTGFVLPLFLNRITNLKSTAVAIGQYIMIKRSVFEAAGGYEAIKDLVSEDVYLARLIKSYGYKTIFVNCYAAATCRMYEGFRASVNGIIKNIFSFFGNRTWIIVPVILAIVIFFVLPFPLFIISLVMDLVSGHALSLTTYLLGINNVLFFLVWFIISLSQRLPLSVPFLYPILFLNLAYTAALSYYRTLTGEGYNWKGRVVH